MDLESRITNTDLMIVPKPEGVASPERVRYQDSGSRQRQTSAKKKRSGSQDAKEHTCGEEPGGRLDIEA